MADQLCKAKEPLEQRTGLQRRRARYLKQRATVIAGLWLILIVLSSHWVWALIGTFFALFLVFGIDDEVQALEREQHDPMEF